MSKRLKRPKPVRLTAPILNFRIARSAIASFIGAKLAYLGVFSLEMTHLASAAIAVAPVVIAHGIYNLDSWAVDLHTRMKENAFSRAIYHGFKFSPLRYYALNQAERRLERARTQAGQICTLEMAESLKSARIARNRYQGSKDPTHIRTVDYLTRLSDYRRHLFRMAAVSFGAISTVRMVTDPGIYYPSPGQYLGKIAGTALTALYGAAHVDAYIQCKTHEHNAHPFFFLSNRILAKTPLHKAGQWLIKRNVKQIEYVSHGGQLKIWRAASAICRRIPVRIVRENLLAGLEKRKLVVNENVWRNLRDNGALDRIHLMRDLAHGRTPEPIQTGKLPTLKSAVDLMLKNGPRGDALVREYAAYQDQLLSDWRAKDSANKHEGPGYPEKFVGFVDRMKSKLGTRVGY